MSVESIYPRGVYAENPSNYNLEEENEDEYATPPGSSTDFWKESFQENVQKFGLLLHRSIPGDILNTYWEASLCGGNFKERFIVRSLNGKATVNQLEEFRKFQERILYLAPHPNIVNILGCYKEKLPYRICYEYHQRKNIRDILLEEFQPSRNSTKDHLQRLILFIDQIAGGMEFLKSKKFDHVALQTEKVLISGWSSCKLYDFCLSSQSLQHAIFLLEENQSLAAWLAPEVIFFREYNQMTDVWAFGVLIWEIWSLGELPYDGKCLNYIEKKLKSQHRLNKPTTCPGAIYSMMLSCWKNDANDRKTFHEIRTTLETLRPSSQNNAYDDMDYSLVEKATSPLSRSSSLYTMLEEDIYDPVAADDVEV